MQQQTGLARRWLRTASLAAALTALLAVPAVASAAAAGPTLLFQTTWGGPGQEMGTGVAVAGDGSADVTGLTDSFTTDASAQIFAVKFGAELHREDLRRLARPCKSGPAGSQSLPPAPGPRQTPASGTAVA